MRAEDKCVSQKTAEALKEAGFPQDTERWWSAWSDHAPIEHTDCHELHWELGGANDGAIAPRVAAPDAEEIGVLLPAEVRDTHGTRRYLHFNKENWDMTLNMEEAWSWDYSSCNNEDQQHFDGKTFVNEAEARAAAWLWLKEKGLI